MVILEEKVYMKVPYGVQAEQDMVCELRRSLYRLKKATAAWYKNIRAVFAELNFIQSRADPCVFLRRSGQGAEGSLVTSYCMLKIFWSGASMIKKLIISVAS